MRRTLRPRWNKYLQRAAEVESAKAGVVGAFPSATQTAFLLLEHVENILFGGAAGGGKSSGMLGAALQYADEPGYNAVVFRQKLVDLELPDGLIPRSHEWLTGTDAHWNGSKREWTFPAGNVLRFGYLQHRNDVYNWQGAAAHFYGFEEAGQIDPWCMDYVKSRARRPKVSTIPIRFRYTANPGGIAHEYLYKNFVAMNGVGGYLFVPSLARDNPGLDVRDYLARLEAMTDPVLRKQLKDGDWTAVDRSNALVKEWTKELAALQTRQDARPQWYTPYLAGDIGSRDLTVWLLGYWDFPTATLHVVAELVLRDPSTDDIGTGLEKLTKDTFPGMEIRGFSDVDYRLIKDLRAYGIKLQATAKDDALGARNLTRSWIGKGRIVVSPNCPVLLKTLESGVWNNLRTDYVRTEETGHADPWDTLVYMVRNVATGLNPEPPKDDKPDRPSWLEQQQRPGAPRPVPAGLQAFADAHKKRRK